MGRRASTSHAASTHSKGISEEESSGEYVGGDEVESWLFSDSWSGG